jgi:predicted nucleic acid-binding protein
MMRIYLDTCSIQRPLDSKTQIRIVLEAEAILGILTFCEEGSVELVASDALTFEIERTPNLARREYAREVLISAKTYIRVNARLETRARDFHQRGLQPLDALHLSAAEEANAEYLCTCDDRFLKRAQSFSDVSVSVVDPVELIGALES